jgi:hypothetical protein
MEVTIIDAAKAIRPYLSDLLSAGADRVDGRLAELLSPGAPADKEQSIRDLLGSEPETRDWTAAFLELAEPPEVHAYRERGVASERMPGVLGPVEPIRAKRFECPHRDMLFYRRYVGQPVPLCVTHKCSLNPLDD